MVLFKHLASTILKLQIINVFHTRWSFFVFLYSKVFVHAYKKKKKKGFFIHVLDSERERESNLDVLYI